MNLKANLKTNLEFLYIKFRTKKKKSKLSIIYSFIFLFNN